MSAIYDKTDNYALNLYGDNDPADLRDGYNGSMRTIDATLETHLNRIEGAEARENHDEEVMKALLVDNTVDNAAAAKIKWDKADANATAANAKADSNAERIDSLEPRVQLLEQRGNVQRNIVVLGDSWTVVHDNALYNRLKSVMPYAVWHNYGINGAVIQQLPEEIGNAKKDASLHAESVTDVIIVIGTNNVFWTNLSGYPDITEDAAYIAFKAVRDYFPNSNITFFPNNSKTLNGGRNALYGRIISGARRAGVATCEESLNLLCGHIDWFNGDDQEGVQHLSDNGYRMFADRIADVINGGVLYQDGLMNSIFMTPSNADDSSHVTDDTIQIYHHDKTADSLISDGWINAEIVKFNYYSDQSVNIQIRGVVKITNTSLSQNGDVTYYLGCPNWYKRISKNTLPYVFLGKNREMYNVISKVPETPELQSYIGSVDSSKSAVTDYDSFYISAPKIKAEYDGKTIEVIFNRVATAVAGM